MMVSSNKEFFKRKYGFHFREHPLIGKGFVGRIRVEMLMGLFLAYVTKCLFLRARTFEIAF